MASTARVLVDPGDGNIEGQPAADFGAIVVTQSPVLIRPDGPEQTIAAHLGDFANELDAARSVPGLWIYPGNGNDGAPLAPNQTVFPVPGGYTPGFVEVGIGRGNIYDFTATDGANVVITGLTFGSADVVRIKVLKAGAIANAASNAAVDIISGSLGLVSEISGPSIIQYGADKTGANSSGTAFNANATALASITVPPGTYVIRENITLAGHLKFMKGAVLKPANGVTVFFDDLEIDAGFWQIFDLSLGGKVVCGSRTFKAVYIYVDWFGAKPGNAADQSTFIQNAITFAETCGGTVFFRVGRWRCDQPLNVRNMCTLQGVRAPMTVSPDYPWVSVLDFSATTGSGVIVNPEAQSLVYGSYIYDLAIIGSGSRGAKPSIGNGVDFRGVHGGKIHRCAINNFGENVVIDDCVSNPSIHCEVISCHISNPRYRTLRYGGATTVVVDRCLLTGRAHLENGDGTVRDDPEIIDEIVLISGVNRCISNPTCDTGNFTNNIIGTQSHSRNIVTFKAGMYMSFRSCDMESSTNAGVEFAFTEYRDASLNTCTLNDVWWNGVGTCVSSVGKIQSFRVESCRLDTSDQSSNGVYVANSEGGLREVDIVVEDSHFIVRTAGGSGVTIFNAKGVSITNNRIRMIGAASAQPGVTIGGQGNTVTLNRLTTTYNDANNLNGVNDGGTGNLVVNNLRV